jgi:(1->4)-alpha-D-glucan 1-alpha-D-glucosylmutase
VLKLTCPGVPDCYQGTELWDLGLVDPDNRRPVDYARRRALLEELKARSIAGSDERIALCRELVKCLPSGRAKLYAVLTLLSYRRGHEGLFVDGAYVPLAVEGSKASHVCAFARRRGGEEVVVVVPRLVFGLLGGREAMPLGPAVWEDTRLLLAEGQGAAYRNLFTAEDVSEDGVLLVGEALKEFPVAVCERVTEGGAAEVPGGKDEG